MKAIALGQDDHYQEDVSIIYMSLPLHLPKIIVYAISLIKTNSFVTKNNATVQQKLS